MLRPRVILAFCAAASLAVGAYAVLAPSGLPRLRELEAEQRSLEADVAKARAENEALTREVKVLQGNAPESKAVLEKAAREELGWARPGEVIITTSPPSPPAAPATEPR